MANQTPVPAPRIIAVVGLCGTGKSEAVAFLSTTLSAPVVYFGGLVLKEVERRGLPINAANERMVREELRAAGGMAAIGALALPEIDAQLRSSPLLIIDGLYSYAEYEMLSQQYGPALFLIAIHASRDVRYQRMAARPVRALTAQEVDQRDQSEIKNLDKGGPIAIADAHLVNNAGIEDLRMSLRTIMQGRGLAPLAPIA